MSITIEQIDHLAHLARLELTSVEKKKYQKDISAILEYVKKIQEIHEKTPKIIMPTGADSVVRADIVANCPDDEREAIINAFPEKERNLNKVKAVFE
ncbi:MAG TPA: Asp-tRNA(Asn)/Glu-tRNA(Gln) amidotransferase GatCAB subunit C [Candidatus Magasanikbacteria bacterium]|nr:Asp-tRNA(Asn)/Glu-tRNA(Gln) amidotransferase GatCAB subunit C [Candidatus Magasanikbacteria bacterium]HBX16186.1 Asp-tRNA(Asn)/Glu-tRNA(Gln) amidotransferase GatCAB subunit C [Candidatus Magasanikbacteria bacterium]